MNVGDYVRTKRGLIGKIKAIDNQTELEDLYLVKRKWYHKEDIIKSAEGTPKGLLSLIEVGDYVNGHRVSNVFDEYITTEDDQITIDKENIKSIVTKEQFESMEYKVGE